MISQKSINKIVIWALVCSLLLSLFSGCSGANKTDDETENHSIYSNEALNDDSISFSMNGTMLDDEYEYTIAAKNDSGFDIIGFTMTIQLLDERGNVADEQKKTIDEVFGAGSTKEIVVISKAKVNDYTIKWGYSDYTSENTQVIQESNTEVTTLNISGMTEKEVYDLAIDYYNSGLYSKAFQLFNGIVDYEDSKEYYSNCSLLLDYEGIYKSSLLSDGWYYVISGNTLTHFDFTKEKEGKAANRIDNVVLSDYEGQTCLINKIYADELNYSGVTYYVLTTDDSGKKCIKVISPFDRHENDHEIYIWNTNYTKEELFARLNASQRMTPPQLGMTTDEVKSSTWGDPDHINKTTTQFGIREQWVYSDNRYVYFVNGTVSAIQE